MSYLSKTLLPGEVVEYQARIHWLVFVPGVGLFLLMMLFWAAKDAAVLAAGCGVLSVFLLVGAWVSRISTELAVTNKRVIAKVGLIRRDTLELQLSKVESYQVDQTILGRILGYGTITISGTGSASLLLKNIDDPLMFRKESMRLADSV